MSLASDSSSATKAEIPRLGETDGTSLNQKKVYQIWTIPSVGFVWCVAELNPEEDMAFGYANLGDDSMAEWGLISIEELRQNEAKMVQVPGIMFETVRKYVLPENGCPKCTSSQYGFQTVQRQDPELMDDTFEIWLCRNCGWQPFTDIRGLV